MKTLTLLIVGLVFTISLPRPSDGGLLAQGVCYGGCAGMVCACFAAAGFTFGTVPGAIIAATPALAACNTAFGACEAACMAALFLPTP